MGGRLRYTVVFRDPKDVKPVPEPADSSISISAVARYLSEESDPQAGRYVFAYEVTIRNDGQHSAQLLRRHWVITDSDAQIQEVRGDGVVGEQPWLEPGDTFTYHSGAVIATAVGSMHGDYEFIRDNGATFLAPIPKFSLSVPRTLH